MQRLDRRTLLRSTGTLAAAGLLAGCSSPESDSESGSGDDEDGGDMAETTEEDTSGDSGGSSSDASEEVSSYLSGVSNFDGTVTDMTGQDIVTVAVGTEGNGDASAFSPAAVGTVD